MTQPQPVASDGGTPRAGTTIDANEIDALITDALINDARVADARLADARVAGARLADARIADAQPADAQAIDAASPIQGDCTTKTIKRLIEEAKAARGRGAWASGQAVMERVLSCRRSASYVELAAELACGARDRVRGHRYYLELTPDATNSLGESRRAHIEKKCRPVGIVLP
jgi:hypothetical protein